MALAKPAISWKISFSISVGTYGTINSTSYAIHCECRKHQSGGVEGDSTPLYRRQIEIVAHPLRTEKVLRLIGTELNENKRKVGVINSIIS